VGSKIGNKGCIVASAVRIHETRSERRVASVVIVVVVVTAAKARSVGRIVHLLLLTPTTMVGKQDRFLVGFKVQPSQASSISRVTHGDIHNGIPMAHRMVTVAVVVSVVESKF